MNRRTELVSQWRERLASAEHLADGTPRFRWIHSARVRLYRFLLSCYSSGQWREDARENASVPFTATEVELPLDGKPPKSVGKIQSVLKAVHSAQDHAPPAGPLTGGLDPQTYMAVTDSDARMDVARCETFLLDNGFHPRVVGRGRRLTVEVPYHELREAEALLESRREWLRPILKSNLDKLLHKPPLPEETQMLIVGLVLIAPVMGVATLVVGSLLVGWLFGELSPYGLAGLFLGGFLVAANISLVWYFHGPRWRNRMSLATRRRMAVAVCWLCAGVPAAFVIAFAIWGMPHGPLVQSLTSPPVILATMLTVIGLIAIGFEWLLRR
ncbi:MAG TPA: hypothetical protein VMP01_23225 [Pirellulaceae bacterium]|nr:hypothetical protein [Pirellulaceae bacterium]